MTPALSSLRAAMLAALEGGEWSGPYHTHYGVPEIRWTTDQLIGGSLVPLTVALTVMGDKPFAISPGREAPVTFKRAHEILADPASALDAVRAAKR